MSLIPYIFIMTQMIIMFCLRKLFLMTVYQTVVAYGAVCLIGLGLTRLSDIARHRAYELAVLRDSYLVVWSGIHSVIILGILTVGSYYLTLTQITFTQIVNIFLGITVYWALYFLLGKADQAIGWGNLLICLTGVANHYLMRFRGAPFQLSDFKAAATAANVVQNYDFSLDIVLIACVLDLLIWYLVWKQYLRCGIWVKKAKSDGEKNGRRNFRRIERRVGGALQECPRWNIWGVVVTILISSGCISLPLIHFADIYANTAFFAEDTYLAKLLAEAMGNVQMLPGDYDLENVDLVIDRFRGEYLSETEQGETASPNIIVIMNEAFSDLRVLGELETTLPVLPYWDSIQENCVRGWANVSVLGGTTANSEYEFLTSDAVGVYANVIPYNKYFAPAENYPGLVSVLKEQGYETTAFHPYLSSGWNRPTVYRAMGFDHIIFSEDIDSNMDTLRLYVSDAADYSYMIDYFAQKQPEIPQFFFNVTMQNHGGYTYEGGNFETTVQLSGEVQGRFSQTEQYLSCMRASDEALKELFSYFESYEEPVMIVLFGDHQPKLEDQFYEYLTGQDAATWSLEQRMNQYKTPFVIWRNYSKQGEDVGDVSVNYLAALVLQQAGLAMSEYQKYVLWRYQQLPVITTLGAMDAQGCLYAAGSEQYRALTKDYRLLIYNHTVDKEGRKDDFFCR